MYRKLHFDEFEYVCAVELFRREFRVPERDLRTRAKEGRTRRVALKVSKFPGNQDVLVSLFLTAARPALTQNGVTRQNFHVRSFNFLFVNGQKLRLAETKRITRPARTSSNRS